MQLVGSPVAYEDPSMSGMSGGVCSVPSGTCPHIQLLVQSFFSADQTLISKNNLALTCLIIIYKVQILLYTICFRMEEAHYFMLQRKGMS